MRIQAGYDTHQNIQYIHVCTIDGRGTIILAFLYRHVTFDLLKNTIPNNLLFSCSHLRQSDVTNDFSRQTLTRSVNKIRKNANKEMKVC